MQWKDYYKIVLVEDASSATNWMLDDNQKYEIRDYQDNLIGTYKDKKYAIKQAKFKFKKLQAKLEKILLA